MSLSAAAGGFLVLFLTVTVVNGNGRPSVSLAFTKICALKGSTVSIQCSLTSNKRTTKRFWFAKWSNGDPLDLMTDSDYTGRVTYDRTGRNCSLRITDLRDSDSAVYKFRITTNNQKKIDSPGVTLTVTDLRVQMRRVTVQTELSCESDCYVSARPSYVWYKNGEKMKEGTRSIQVTREDYYSCAFKGSEEYRSPPKYIKFLFVSVSPSGEIIEGSSVTLTCNQIYYYDQAATFYWFRNEASWHTTANKQLIFSSITSTDSGEYYCVSWNTQRQWSNRSMSVFIDVKYAPKFPQVSVRPSGEIREGSSVTLTCHSEANPAAEYKWYRRNQDSHLTVNNQLIFTSITSSDSGDYHCIAENKLGNSASQAIVIDVKYAPKHPSVSVSPSGDIVEGRSVTLTCNSDANPAATYYWTKRHQYLEAGKYLTFESIASFNSGEYQCEAQNSLGREISQSVFVDVKYAPKSLSVSGISSDIVEGSSVTLTCSSDANPVAKYSWYRKNTHKPISEERNLVFMSIQSSESGEYHCSAENDLGSRTSQAISIDVKYAPKPPTVSVHPSDEITEGDSVTLTCSSDANPAANYTWYIQGEESPKGSGQNFTISNILFQHRGFYYCEAQNSRGRRNATLQLQVVTSPWKLTTAATVPTLLLAVTLIPMIVWIIKNKTSKQQSEPGERRDTWEQVKPAEDDVVYTTVLFQKQQADPVCFSFRSHQLGRHVKVKRREETVVYTTVKFNSNRSDVRTETRDQEVVEDPDALYSTINK